MKEYIDKKIAQVLLRTECLAKYPSSYANGLLAAADQLNKLESADVVEVVRCKDCKWWEARSCNSFIGRCENPLNGLVSEYTDDEDFCSYGERKEQE